MRPYFSAPGPKIRVWPGFPKNKAFNDRYFSQMSRIRQNSGPYGRYPQVRVPKERRLDSRARRRGRGAESRLTERPKERRLPVERTTRSAPTVCADGVRRRCAPPGARRRQRAAGHDAGCTPAAPPALPRRPPTDSLAARPPHSRSCSCTSRYSTCRNFLMFTFTLPPARPCSRSFIFWRTSAKSK